MPDRDDRPVRDSPGIQQCGDVRLTVRIVPAPPELEVAEPVLDIDDHQHGISGHKAVQRGVHTHAKQTAPSCASPVSGTSATHR